MAIKLPRVIDRTSFIVRIKLEFFNKSTKKTDFCSYFSNNQELPKYKIAARSSKLTKLKTKAVFFSFVPSLTGKLTPGLNCSQKGLPCLDIYFQEAETFETPILLLKKKFLLKLINHVQSSLIMYKLISTTRRCPLRPVCKPV